MSSQGYMGSLRVMTIASSGPRVTPSALAEMIGRTTLLPGSPSPIRATRTCRRGCRVVGRVPQGVPANVADARPAGQGAGELRSSGCAIEGCATDAHPAPGDEHRQD